MHSKRWFVAPPPTATARAALEQEGYPPLVAQLLFNRGLATPPEARRFLEGTQTPDDDPLLLTGMATAIERLQYAVRNGESIAIYGDYDADGVTATALLVQCLTELGAHVFPYIPQREDEGYGLHIEALHKLKNDYAARLIVTVDCGIRSLTESEAAQELGLDLIITDHHHPGTELPRAVAVINPKQSSEVYPEKGLAGVGLAYKLAQGLTRAMGGSAAVVTGAVDLVALGTVTDLAPLIGENRHLVRQGLKLINQPRREGLRALLETARLKPGTITAGDISFVLGPRLNAAGRMESALAAYELLLTNDAIQARRQAWQLEQQNRERQELTHLTHLRAREIALAEQRDQPLLFAADDNFKEGIIGLAAARLCDEFYRPAVVVSRGPLFSKGSARSIREFHITTALDECRDLLVRHGGHAAAAGFTVETAKLKELTERLESIAARELAGIDLCPALHIDAEITAEAITGELYAWLQRFEPCGYGNPAPVLASRGLKVTDARAVGADGQHLKLVLSDGRWTLDAIAFRQGRWAGCLPPRVDVAYHLEINEWNGTRRLQLNVLDLKPAQQ